MDAMVAKDVRDGAAGASDEQAVAAALAAADVEYRPLQKDDFSALAEIVGEVWHAEFGETERRLAGSVDLATCLRRTTAGLVAVTGERTLGFVLMRAGDIDPMSDAEWRDVSQKALEELHGANPTAGERVAVYSKAEKAIDDQLLAESGCDERYEFVLFLLTASARGLGIGRALFDRAEAYLAQNGAREAFLFTDESCTWGFYEHRGLRRVGEYRPPKQEGDLLSAYYIYVDELDADGRGE